MRYRSSLALLLVLGAAVAAPAAASAPDHDSTVHYVQAHPTPDTTVAYTLTTTENAVEMTVDLSQPAPTPERRTPLEPLSLLGFALMGATAKKKTATRRARGVKRPDVPMYLDTAAHVMRDDELVIIPGGVLVDDTELEDEEIADFIQRGVVRPATPEEIARLEEAESKEAATQLAAEQEQEMKQLQANQAAELAGAAEADKPKIAEKHAKQISDLQAKHAKALNASA